MTDTACGRDPLVDAISTFLAHMHTPGLRDIRATLETVRAVLPKLMEQGFHFEKVTDILCPTKS